ncbi:Lsr2 family protein [Lentzea sp. NBRC 105346]|uniref:histone-like nucleoid-structuring protein Lsr2 n=1 Tax=Lentzea sp. NBRC 105346 TaxID=3032205 RepID=UPI0024A4F51F|nr:Lsr2 family protein [Lentzea sp. NBRC 105346]GLZ30120.1 Lsr2 family protein [Lentzea sp. NBRC 105346]
MAVQIIVRKIDDLDGTSGEDVSTVHFGLDGIRYEIDLTPAHAEELRAILAEFIEAAHQGQAVAGELAYVDRRELPGIIRNWAVQNGFNLCGRGRIPNAAIVAFKYAHDDGPDSLKLMCDDLLDERHLP